MIQSTISPINILVEGYTDEVIIRRILNYVGLSCGNVYGKKGKSKLLERLPHYNQAAHNHGLWLVVVDLDQDADCAPSFAQQTLTNRSEKLLFRIAVRAIEAWLLADSERIATFLGISSKLVPLDPDKEPDPKTSLVNLSRRSRRRSIVEDIVPRQGSGGRVGPGYPGRLTEFVTNDQSGWRPDVAMQHSDSLRRCIIALQALLHTIS